MAGPELMIASAAVSAVGAMQQGRAQARAYNYNAQINERNALVAEQEGEQLILENEDAIVRFKRDFAKLQAATQQAQRYNGWMASCGTPLKVALEYAAEADEVIAVRG